MLKTTPEGVTVSITTNEPKSLWDALEPEFMTQFLKERFARHTIKSQELLAGFGRFKRATANGIPSEEIAQKATDFARQLRDEVTEVDKTHTAVKAPILYAYRQIDHVRRELAEPLVAARSEVNKRLTDYMEAKDRLEREAALRAAQEAAERAQAALDQAATANDPDTVAAALETAQEAGEQALEAEAVLETKPAELTRIRTQLGSTSSLKYEWVYDGVDDITKVPWHLLMVNEPAAKLAIRQGATLIPGLRIVQRAKATVR